MPGQVRAQEDLSTPLQLGLGLTEVASKTQTCGQIAEDQEVGTGFAQRLDALVLQHNHPMVELIEVVVRIPSRLRPFANIPTFKIGTCRQYDVSETGLAFVPDGLIDDEFEFR